MQPFIITHGQRPLVAKHWQVVYKIRKRMCMKKDRTQGNRRMPGSGGLLAPQNLVTGASTNF